MTDIWRGQVETACRRHMSEPAARTASALLASFHTVEQIAIGRTDPYLKQAAVQVLMDLTFGLALDDFWKKHSSFISPCFTMALNAWLDSHDYAAAASDQVTDPLRVRAMLARAVIIEVATACLMSDVGPIEARKRSRSLRDDLMAVKE